MRLSRSLGRIEASVWRQGVPESPLSLVRIFRPVMRLEGEGQSTSKERGIHHQSYLVDSTLGFFTTRSFSYNSSSSSLVPRAGNLRFSSANSSLFSQTCTTCCTFSFFRFSRATSVLASSNDCASSDCKRKSLSEDVACDARVFRTDLISRRRKHM